MAFTAISTGQVDANSPLDTTLMDLIRTNLDDLNGRLSGQLIYVQSTSTSTLNIAIPDDGTNPQITEGKEVLSGVITPLSSSDKIIIQADISVGMLGTASTVCMALFLNSGSSALQAKYCPPVVNIANVVGQYTLQHIIDPIGTTAASTFSIRVGGASTSNLKFNADAIGSKAKYGGSISNMTITEIATT